MADLPQSGRTRRGLSFRFWGEPHRTRPDRPPVVIVHGLFGSHKNWVRTAERLAEDRFTVALDARNHGDSFHSETMNYRLMGEDLEELLAELNLEKAVILGHSMGGLISVLYSLLFPARVRALVVVDIAPAGERPNPEIEGVAAAMDRIDFTEIRDRREVLERLEEYGVRSRTFREFLLLSNLRRSEENPGLFRWISNIKGIRANMGQILSWPEELCRGIQRDLPVLLIAGGNSAYVQPAGVERMLEHFPDREGCPTEVRTIPEAGHWPHTETPKEFLSILNGFLRRVEENGWPSA